MISHLIFNDQSVPFQSVEDVDLYFPQFLNIIKEASDEGFVDVKVSEFHGKGWYETDLTQTINIREWLKGKDKNYEMRIKSLIDKTICPLSDGVRTEIIKRHANSEFIFSDKKVDALGYAFLLKQLAISYRSLPIWDNEVFTINQETLNESEDELLVHDVFVPNCSTTTHWESHLPLIRKLRKNYLEKGSRLLQNIKIEFEHIELCGKASELKHIEYFDSFYHVLDLLNKFCKEHSGDFNLEEFKDFSTLDVSPESDTVESNPKYKNKRTFRVDGVKHYFTFHVKNFPNNYRLYFLPLNDKIYVGYYGKHLPTKRNPK